jgi:hypothetical protein
MKYVLDSRKDNAQLKKLRAHIGDQRMGRGESTRSPRDQTRRGLNEQAQNYFIQI